MNSYFLGVCPVHNIKTLRKTCNLLLNFRDLMWLELRYCFLR